MKIQFGFTTNKLPAHEVGALYSYDGQILLGTFLGYVSLSFPGNTWGKDLTQEYSYTKFPNQIQPNIIRLPCGTEVKLTSEI